MLHSLDDVSAALLARIPENARASFFAPPQPRELTEAEHGLSADVLQEARERLEFAAEHQQKVVIFGDYDADGVCATAVLWETLRARELTAQPFLPHRERHGYGLSIKALQEIEAANGLPALIVTVDNGIVAHEAIAWLRERGVDVIVTDHHQALETLPAANVILHTQQLCGTTIAWVLSALLHEPSADKHLDLAALATFADQVPLYGANRSFAVHGLAALRNTNRPSLRALAEVANLDLATASPGTISFGLAPRLNAMGRLGDALDALRALVSRHPERVQMLAQTLQTVNTERQQLTASSWEAIHPQVQAQKDDAIIVAHGEFHEGIIGLLASKITETYQRPSIVLSCGEAFCKASCRSVPGFDMISFLRSCQELPFVALGGHPMAAGFTITASDREDAIAIFHAKAEVFVPALENQPENAALGVLEPTLLSAELVSVLERFAPFGAGNLEPLFILTGQLDGQKLVGKLQQHARLTLKLENGKTTNAMWFSVPPDRLLHLATYTQWLVSVRDSNYRPGTLDLTLKNAWA